MRLWMISNMLMVNRVYFNIYWADLNPVIGREQSGHRPVLVISNDIENQMDNVTIIPITSLKSGRKVYPNEVLITLENKEALLLCHQIRTISKQRIGKQMSTIENKRLQKKITETLCIRFQPF